MSNECMQTLETLGFQADSSAIPRPNYSWERNLKDWKTTPQEPYYPSVDDYRIPDTNKRSLKILEIPMSMTRISLPGDTVKMLRYIDPAYDSDLFLKFCDGGPWHRLLILFSPTRWPNCNGPKRCRRSRARLAEKVKCCLARFEPASMT